jgi:predicted nucleic acid-binding protein
MKDYVLDASALMTFFENRAGAEKVEKLLTGAADANGLLAMSVINWSEVYYSIWRAHGEKAAGNKLQEIAQLPIPAGRKPQSTVQSSLRRLLRCRPRPSPEIDCRHK